MNFLAGILHYLPEKLYSRVIGRDAIFKSTTNKTFENEENLPDLPVPPLKNTLDTYLESVRAVVTEEEYKQTETIVRNFENGVGDKLQKMLIKRAENSKNWLEQWWEDLAYLQLRLPLIPCSNMTGSQPSFDFWPTKTGTQFERLALILYYHMQFWQLLRKEQFKPIVNKGTHWSMFQFKRVFNTCRIPGEVKDTLITNFKTESEGSMAPTNIIILNRGYIFSFDLLFNGELLTAPEIEAQLKYIDNWCQQQSQSGPAVGALTTTDRTKWAQNRNHLKSIDPKNSEILDTIENSLFVAVFDDNQPITQEEILREALLGNCVDRWADKSLTDIAFKNGNFAANADHTCFDGMAIASECQFVLLSIAECKGVYNGPNLCRSVPQPNLLSFETDDKILGEIESAKLSYRKICDTIEITYKVFEEYGRSVSAKHQIHPEAYIQIAIQLAYYRTHGKPATTYCTATTRKFYHGRTETCRACTPESVEFAKAVLDGNKPESELYLMLQKAGEKFQQIMSNACNGFGCDRHLLGLYLTALENGIEIPEIFIDPSFVKSGGNGNYVLSTSCAGYWNICGSVPPMIEEGYSFFYGIEPHQYSFTIASYKTCPETSAELLHKNLNLSLIDMQKILDSKQ